MSGDDKAFMTQAEYSRHRGVVRSTVTVWKNRGRLVIDAKGRIDVAASDRALDERPKVYRGGSTEAPTLAPAGDLFGEAARAALAPVEEVDPDSSRWSQATATRVKETYLALQRKAEYEKLIGQLVSIEEVARQVEADYAAIKERLLTIPGKIAASLVGLGTAAIDEALQAEIIEALGDLYEPARDRDRTLGAGGAAEAGAFSLSAAGQA